MATEQPNKLLAKIFEELKAHTEREDGNVLALDEFIFHSLINGLQNGMTRQQAYRTAGISHETFHRYLNRSKTFRETIEASEDFTTIAALVSVHKAIVGTPARKRKALDRDRKLVEVEDPPIPGDVNTAKWLLERRDKRFMPKTDNTHHFDDAPQSEEEELAAERMLQKYAERKKLRAERGATDTGENTAGSAEAGS
jgi:hypothetical protein